MRLLLLSFAALIISAASAADLSIVRVTPSYREAASFERISEFFNGEENTGGQTVLRTQPATRAGFYFLTRYKAPSPISASVELKVITPASTQPSTFTFPATDLRAGSHVLQLGLTGSDWPDAAAAPVAWHLRILAADGQVLAHEQSFLWSIDAH